MKLNKQKFHFEGRDRALRDQEHRKQGQAILKATGGQRKENNAGDNNGSDYEDSEVDEMGTIHLIESLDPESKKVLNALVQSVLITQQENDKDKLSLLKNKRQIVAAENKLEKEKIDYQK